MDHQTFGRPFGWIVSWHEQSQPALWQLGGGISRGGLPSSSAHSFSVACIRFAHLPLSVHGTVDAMASQPYVATRRLRMSSGRSNSMTSGPASGGFGWTLFQWKSVSRPLP